MNKQEIEKAIECFKLTSEKNHEGNAREIAIECMERQLTNGWIPVSSGKMPEFNTNCLVTADNGEVWTSKFYGYGEECQGFREYPDGVWEINQCELDVIAWQPLPESYKEVSD